MTRKQQIAKQINELITSPDDAQDVLEALVDACNDVSEVVDTTPWRGIADRVQSCANGINVWLEKHTVWGDKNRAK